MCKGKAWSRELKDWHHQTCSRELPAPEDRSRGPRPPCLVWTPSPMQNTNWRKQNFLIPSEHISVLKKGKDSHLSFWSIKLGQFIVCGCPRLQTPDKWPRKVERWEIETEHQSGATHRAHRTKQWDLSLGCFETAPRAVRTDFPFFTPTCQVSGRK